MSLHSKRKGFWLQNAAGESRTWKLARQCRGAKLGETKDLCVVIPVVDTSLSAHIPLGSRSVWSDLLEGKQVQFYLKNDLPLCRPSSAMLPLFFGQDESVECAAAH